MRIRVSQTGMEMAMEIRIVIEMGIERVATVISVTGSMLRVSRHHELPSRSVVL